MWAVNSPPLKSVLKLSNYHENSVQHYSRRHLAHATASTLGSQLQQTTQSLFVAFSAHTSALCTYHGWRTWIAIAANDMTMLDAIAIYSLLSTHLIAKCVILLEYSCSTNCGRVFFKLFWLSDFFIVSTTARSRGSRIWWGSIVYFYFNVGGQNVGSWNFIERD